MPPKKKEKGDDTLGHTKDILTKECLMQEIRITNELEKADRARTNEKELQKRLEELSDKYQEQGTSLEKLSLDMTKQYKRMQDEYQNQIQDLKKELLQKEQQLAQIQNEIENQVVSKEQELKRADEEIEELKKKIEEMSSEFAKMLQETLSKMRDRIEMVQWDDSEQNMNKRLKDMSNLNN